MCAAKSAVARAARAVYTLALGALLAACAVTPREFAPFYQRIPTENRPVTAPVRSISSFSESLVCMDRMLRDYAKGTTLITSKIIPDASGKVSVATKDMVITALSQMSRTSQAFRYVDYEVEALKQDTVQNLTTLLLNAGQMRLGKPALYISGAVAYMDQNVMINRLGAGVAGERFEAGYNRDLQGSAFGLEMHLGDFGSRTLLAGIDSANEIVVANAARALDAGGRIRKTGVQFNVAQEVSQGTGPAVRTLVELGLIELVGKWARVPYWQCLAIDQAHPEYQRQLRAWWDDMSGDERVKLFQTALKSSGYFDGEPDGKPNPRLRDAIARLQADRRVVVSGNMDFESYEKLVADYVVFDGAGTFTRIGWARERKTYERADPAKAEARGGAAKVAENPAYTPQAAGARLPAPPIDSKHPRAVGLAVSIGETGREFSPGEQLAVRISVDRQSYVHCYYRDVRRQITRIYPNPDQKGLPLQGGQALQIPDTSADAAFSIDLQRPGMEAIGCFASERDLTAKLPEEFRGPPLAEIPWVNDYQQIRRAYEGAAGQPVEARIIEFKVRNAQ
jgi:peptidoglycan hydrolase-like protein with peptidoglycan-binding domain